MNKMVRSKWVSFKEKSLWACGFDGWKADRQGLAAEIQAVETFMWQQLPDSMVVALNLDDTQLTPELVEFFKKSSKREKNPIRKLAILGVSAWQRIWYQQAKGIVWPKNAKFFDDWEKAKAWLVGEGF